MKVQIGAREWFACLRTTISCVYVLTSLNAVKQKCATRKFFIAYHCVSKLDVNSSFWQIKLEEESKLLTTFITPFGRYAFNRLPMRLSSSFEYF